MKNVSLQQFTTPIAQLLRRFHVILFFLFAIGGLALIIFFMNNLLTMSSAAEQQNTNAATQLDRQTIDVVERFRTSDDSTTVPFPQPAGRQSPFRE